MDGGAGEGVLTHHHQLPYRIEEDQEGFSITGQLRVLIVIDPQVLIKELGLMMRKQWSMVRYVMVFNMEAIGSKVRYVMVFNMVAIGSKVVEDIRTDHRVAQGNMLLVL